MIQANGGLVSRDNPRDVGAGRGRIRQLPEGLIDQIAAGEVVERPASVVKELVENALDAGASRVRVELRAGGRDWIAVGDDGCGMGPDQARLALARHATSKIASGEDLSRIATYGFRGEALPAIASVSRMRLRSRPRDAAIAFEIGIEAGRIVRAREAGGAPGTRVEVADLFANVPARRKFLKAAATEWGHVADWLARSALARPDVHFDVARDDRPALAWPAVRALEDRVAAVLGEEEMEALVPVDRAAGPARLHGFASRPDRHRPTLSGVYWYVNRRPVRDRMLQHALSQAYREVLPRGRFPYAVLFLELPFDALDVNVHPAKWEVRFGDPQAVHRLVRHAVREALSARSWIGGSEAPPVVEPMPPHTHAARPRAGPAPRPPSDWVLAEPAAELYARAGSAEGAGVGAETGMPLRFADQRLLGQLLATYLVLETKDRLLLVDQHAAHERVLYERLCEQWRARAVEGQGLLVPQPVRLEPARLRALLDAGERLARLGFEIEPFGEDTALVRAIPALLAGRDPSALVRELADELVSAGPAAGEPALDAARRLFASLACHAARRKGDVLDPREQQALLDALDAIPWAPTCPHGRPVAVPFGLAEIERRFARR
jgi:DNA mismatch repair protein MutL